MKIKIERGALRGKFKRSGGKHTEVETLMLKHYGEKYFKMEENMRDDLMTRTDDELRRLWSAVNKVTRKNSWYAVYRVSDSLRETLMEVMKRKGINK